MDLTNPSTSKIYHLRKCARKTDDSAIPLLVADFDSDFAADKIVEECDLSSTTNSSEKDNTVPFQLKVRRGRKRTCGGRKQIPNRKHRCSKQTCIFWTSVSKRVIHLSIDSSPINIFNIFQQSNI
jgi:hypothetical protein